MGLDMYLNKVTYVGGQFEHSKVKGELGITVKDQPLTVKTDRLVSVKEQVGYWHKANAIHQWFVENVQDSQDDCKTYEVSEEQLKDLLGMVKEVLADHSLANEMLPTQAGLFFGGTEYDKWYFKDLEDTQKIIEDALKEVEDDPEPHAWFEYDSSW